MILVILVLGILMAVWGIKLELDKPIVGVAFQIIGAVVSLASIIIVVLLLGCVVDRVGIDKKLPCMRRKMPESSSKLQMW